MKTFLKLTIILFPIFTFSQITIGLGMGKSQGEGILYLKEGEKIKGEINFPEENDKSVKVNKVKYKSTLIDSIVYSNCTFIFTKAKEYNEKKENYKYFDKEVWMCKILNGKASLFIYGEKYGFKKDKMIVNTGELQYYAIRKGEDVPTFIALDLQKAQLGVKKIFIKHSSFYFSDNKKIKSRIENNDYNIKEIETLINDYNSKKY